MSWVPPAPLPILAPPRRRGGRAGPLETCFTARDAVDGLQMLEADWPPLGTLAPRLVTHLGLGLAVVDRARTLPLSVWLVQRAALRFGEALRQPPDARGRAFALELLDGVRSHLPGLRIDAVEGSWEPLSALPLPVFLDCHERPRLRYVPPVEGEARGLCSWLLADLSPYLRQRLDLRP